MRKAAARPLPETPAREIELPGDLDSIRQMCDTQGGCWLFPRNGTFPCRQGGDTRPRSDLPYLAPHRWTWMVAHGRTESRLPGKIGVRRRCHYDSGCSESPARCVHSLCCNPEHLFLATSSGIELSIAEADEYAVMNRTSGQVFDEDLATMQARCEVTESGCWLAPTAGPVLCRSKQDTRHDADLPKMAPHRWTWSIAHGIANRPLPGHLVQVRRRCDETACCNPDHLYLTSTNGTELTPQAAEVLVASRSEHETAQRADGGDSGDDGQELWHLDTGRPPPTKTNGHAPGDYDHLGDHPLDRGHAAETADPSASQAKETSKSATDLRAELHAALRHALDQFHCGSTSLTGSNSGPSKIRRVLAESIRQSCPPCDDMADALVLAAHPWPAGDPSDAFINALLAEIRPSAATRRPDARRVAADRLRRFEGAANTAGEVNCAVAYRRAAELLEDSFASIPAETEAFALLTELFGSAPEMQPRSDSERSSLQGERVDVPAINLAVASEVILATARSGSDDLGLLLGEQPLGAGVGNLFFHNPAFSAVSALDRFLVSLDERSRDILIRQRLTINRESTYESLSHQWGITQERVHQIIEDVTERCEEYLQEIVPVASVLDSVMQFAVRTENLIVALQPLTRGLVNGRPIAIALVQSAGPWVHENGWSVHLSKWGELESRIDSLLETADGYGLVSEADADATLSYLFLSEDDRESYLQELVGMLRVRNLWSVRGGQRTQVAAALRSLGQPATTQDVATMARIKNQARVENILADHNNVIRTEDGRWIFAGWIEDPYGEVVDAIDGLIESGGGEVAVKTILEELPISLKVKPASVRACLATSVFAFAQGKARRNTSQFAPREPSECGAVRSIYGRWGQRLRLYERHFAGYPLAVSFDIAYANGILPGDDHFVEIEGTDVSASVAWHRYSSTRTIVLRQVSEALHALELEPGDEVVVVVEPERVLVQTAEERPVGRSPMPPTGMEPSRHERPGLNPKLGRPPAGDTGSASGVHDPLYDLLSDQ
jgi:hypothetical protein